MKKDMKQGTNPVVTFLPVKRVVKEMNIFNEHRGTTLLAKL